MNEEFMNIFITLNCDGQNDDVEGDIIHADHWYGCLDVSAVPSKKGCFVICNLCFLGYII
jgi:hypothetical protein